MTILKQALFVFVLIPLAVLGAHGQAREKNGDISTAEPVLSIRSSPTYAEILLRKTEIQADLEALSSDYTPDHPKILDLRAEIVSLDKELEKVFGVKASETGKLTLALGKLIVRKASLDAELAHLMRSYSKDHPEVKRAQRRVDYFDSAIKEVLR